MSKLVSKKSSVVILLRVLWMILLLLHLHSCFFITAATCIQKEREALLQFKNSFSYDPSHPLASWNNGTDCCNWKGVGCNQITGHVTIIDLRSDDYQILDLAHNQLEGDIPPNLSNFDVMTRKRSKDGYYYYCEYSDAEMCYHSEKYVVQNIKSSELNYSMEQLKTFLVKIDLSKNHLVGSIPSEVIMLKGLFGLNLSHNNLVGTIPAEIGEMEVLESLDLSFNKLSGPIPRSLSKLSSLGVLVLSHNNLSGEIPREGHLSTYNEASNFDDNPYLCGDPLPTKCVNENSSEPQLKDMNNVDEEEDKWEKWLVYIMIIVGFIVGFWGVVGSLILKKSWRYKYFKFVDETYYKVDATIWKSIEFLKGICIPK
ncbi:receptor-like protein EIX1 isoform X2 [Cucumis melo]|uniref:Receptor-like protein EIX1 isoform X2 n=1 Tax=Cucumis melo TaxID=3656 RepID=A0ABM3L6U4_CUCME|nr:receptor-like protein EIX1 isoform X2 [Cucumis melo]